MSTPDVSWDDLAAGGLPCHDDEILSAHGGRPTEAEHVRNGATPPPGGTS
jgi:hypothetical protein